MTLANDGRAERLGERHQQQLAGHDADQRADQRRGHGGERAEEDGQQDQRNTDADELADGRLLLGGEVDQDAARGHLDAAFLGGLGGRQQLLAVRLLEVAGLDVVADVDGGDPPVLRHRGALGKRVGDLGDAVDRGHLVERALDRLAPVLERSVVDAEHDRRVGAREGRAVVAEEVERLLRLGAWDLEVVGHLAA